MLMLPFRLAATLFFTLLIASSLMRRAVAGVVVSTAIVASQHEPILNYLAAVAASGDGLSGMFTAIANVVQY